MRIYNKCKKNKHIHLYTDLKRDEEKVVYRNFKSSQLKAGITLYLYMLKGKENVSIILIEKKISSENFY